MKMRIIMSIRENRSVITNALELRQFSSHPLMCASPILHTCRPDEMYTRSVILYSIHCQCHPGVFQDAFILIPDQICHVLFPWTRESYGCTDKQMRPIIPFGQIGKEVKLGELYIIFLSKMIVILRMLRSLAHFSTASDLVHSSAKHFVVWFVVSQNSVEWNSNHILVWNSKMNPNDFTYFWCKWHKIKLRLL